MHTVISQADSRFRVVHSKPTPRSGSTNVTTTSAIYVAVSGTGIWKWVVPCHRVTMPWMRTTATNTPRSHCSLIVVRTCCFSFADE